MFAPESLSEESALDSSLPRSLNPEKGSSVATWHSNGDFSCTKPSQFFWRRPQSRSHRCLSWLKAAEALQAADRRAEAHRRRAELRQGPLAAPDRLPGVLRPERLAPAPPRSTACRTDQPVLAGKITPAPSPSGIGELEPSRANQPVTNTAGTANSPGAGFVRVISFDEWCGRHGRYRRHAGAPLGRPHRRHGHGGPRDVGRYRNSGGGCQGRQEGQKHLQGLRCS